MDQQRVSLVRPAKTYYKADTEKQELKLYLSSCFLGSAPCVKTEGASTFWELQGVFPGGSRKNIQFLTYEEVESINTLLDDRSDALLFKDLYDNTYKIVEWWIWIVKKYFIKT